MKRTKPSCDSNAALPPANRGRRIDAARTPDAQRPNRLDWLDALRGWAVFGVILVHAGQVAHCTGITQKLAATGQYGVQLFFIVSALTISLTYESHIRQFGRGIRSQLAWLIKRFFRIAPLYYLAAFFYALEQYAIFEVSHHHYGSIVRITDLLANIVFIHTWVPTANNSVVPGGWSIGVEMFFYVLVPFIWALHPVRFRIACLGISAIALLALTLVVSKLTTGSVVVPDDSYLYYWFPTQAPVLIIGLIFYLSYASKLHKFRSAKAVGLTLSGFLLCAAAGVYLGTGDEVAPVIAPTVIAMSFVLLILSLHGWSKRVIVNNYAKFLGQISFSIYIFHFAVIDFIKSLLQIFHEDRGSTPPGLLPILAVIIILSSGIALISKRFIEDPPIAFAHDLSRRVAGDRP